jgi:hypothetical protein
MQGNEMIKDMVEDSFLSRREGGSIADDEDRVESVRAC